MPDTPSAEVLADELEQIARYETDSGMDRVRDAMLRAARALRSLAPTEAKPVAEPEIVGWRVVTWNTATDRRFPTRPEAIDYITMNDTTGDWHIEPLYLAAPDAAPKSDEARELLAELFDVAMRSNLALARGSDRRYLPCSLPIDWLERALLAAAPSPGGKP